MLVNEIHQIFDGARIDPQAEVAQLKQQVANLKEQLELAGEELGRPTVISQSNY